MALDENEKEWPLTPELEASIDAAYTRAQDYVPGPAAVAVQHLPGTNIVLITLSNGRRLALPVEDMQGIAEATPEQLADVALLGPGTGIAFDSVDAAFSVESLIGGVYGNRHWMEQLASRKPKAA